MRPGARWGTLEAMSCLGTGELLTIVLVILIVFSASRMGAIGNALGRFVYSFKKASKGEETIEGQARRIESSPEGQKPPSEPPRPA